MLATCIVAWDAQAGRPVLPLSASLEGGLQLAYTAEDGSARGSFLCLSEVPAPTVVVLIDGPPATLDALRADPEVIWLEDLEDLS